MRAADLLAQLASLPDEWGLVAVGRSKRPYQRDWLDNPLTKAQAAHEITHGSEIETMRDGVATRRLVRAFAIGALAGPASGGLLFVDHDGISASDKMERLGIPLRTLPHTVAWTSGRDGRFQLAYRVPEAFWPSLRTRVVHKTGVLDAEGKAEQVDLRWVGHQSVIVGSHPQTSGYRWLEGRSPADLPVAEAPLALISLLLAEPEPDGDLPLFAAAAQPAPGAVVPLLEFVSRVSRDLVESGGTPGSWNDDHLRLSLDLQGTEAWLLAQGVRPEPSARGAFAQHIAAARTQSKDFDERRAWVRFEGAAERRPRPSTPLENLLRRLAYHTRPQRDVLPPPKPSNEAPAVATVATVATAQQPTPAPVAAKPVKLEAGELLALLRGQAAAGRIRFNIFTQSVEIDGAALQGAERFYLQLAQQGFKAPKELALDCLVEVARENLHDPVRAYLEHVADTVEPQYLGGLATAYLRPEDYAPGAPPTLYDEMLKRTLIGAVKRAFEPGCKHDTATVLMGDQGARKSSFWGALGGPFFSDALGDISTKDDLMVLHRSWIMEWAELDCIVGRKHAGQIKSFLSQSTDLFRVPYGKATETFPRRGIIVGSTNRTSGFLQDDTGNRRFWVIPTTRTEADPIDTPTLMAERDAIWSGAVAAYRSGEANYLPPELAQKVHAENEGHTLANPWQAPVEAWLAAPKNASRAITSEVLLTEAIQRPIERQTRGDQMQVGMILRQVGYQKRRQMVDGALRWVFFRP